MKQVEGRKLDRTYRKVEEGKKQRGRANECGVRGKEEGRCECKGVGLKKTKKEEKGGGEWKE